MYETFIGCIGRNHRKFITNDGFVLTFEQELPLFDEIEYCILVKRNEDKLYVLIKAIYWK